MSNLYPAEHWKSEIDAFVEGARRAGGNGLLNCSSGNLSWRVDDGTCLITATRSWLGDLTAAQVAVCRLPDGVALNAVKPSVEVGFHAGILRARRDIAVVLHFQSPAATAFACRRDVESVDFNLIVEVPFYIGPIAVVPFLMPGSPELATAVTAALTAHNLAILRNHGMVTVGRDFHDALQKAAFFELACQIRIHAGEHAQPLSAEAVCALRAAGTAEHGKV